MKKHFIYFAIVCALWQFQAVAQNSLRKGTVDSLLQVAKQSSGLERVVAYDKLSRQYWQSNADSSIHFASLALTEAQNDKGDQAFGEAYNSMGNAYSAKKEYEIALKYYDKAKEHREQANDLLKVVYTLSNMSIALNDLKRNSESIEMLKQAAEISNTISDYKLEAEMYQQIAYHYRLLHDLNRAIEYSLKAMNIKINHKIYDDIANNYSFIGSLHRDLKNFDLAEDYYLKAYEIWLKENDDPGLSEAYNNLGIIYEEKNDYQKALEYLSKSLDLSKKLNDSLGIATTYNNIGLIYTRIEQIDYGINAYIKSLNISNKINEISSYLNTCNNIAKAYLKKNDLAQSEKYVNTVINKIKEVDDLTIIQETYEILSEVNGRKGNYKKAYEYKKIQLAYNDSLYNQQQIRNIIEMQTRFESEAKEREIQILKKDSDIKQLEYDRQKFFQRILLIISVLLFILIISAVTSFVIIRRSNKLLAQKNAEFEDANIKLLESEKSLKELNATKDKLFSIIAHDLRNPFNALMGFSDLLERNYSLLSEEERLEYIGVISDSTQNLYKLLDNLLQWTRAQTGAITYTPENFKLRNLVVQETEILIPSSEKKKINLSISIDENTTVLADKNSIATVIRNLVSNAIKFTPSNGKIEIGAHRTDKSILVSVTDTGVGINSEDLEKIFMVDSSFTTKGTANETGTGLGLLLCKEFVEKNNGKIWVDSTKGKGSTFYFTLPES
ncbi:MAG: tetratricopeptide repeat-containing sensor histidine kinase [Bacteroidales bacterium]|nr:tetratricopeptide repeat-containing sensor histidine kinase [Bacteroidales bacterium]